jgi:hypothetical protein
MGLHDPLKAFKIKIILIKKAIKSLPESNHFEARLQSTSAWQVE